MKSVSTKPKHRGPNRSWTDAQVVTAVAGADSLTEVLRALGLVLAGGNFYSVGRVIRQLKLDTTHWYSKPRAAPHRSSASRPLDEILVKNNFNVARGNLKRRLIREGLLQEVCSGCDGLMWRGQKLTLHLDHINGDNSDQRLNNLRLLCPNCHSLTNTYCGRNIKLRRKAKRSVSYRCACGRPSEYGRCQKCAQHARWQKTPQRHKIVWPPENILREEVREFGYSAVGRRLGVSDNAVRKHLDKVKIPNK